MTTTFNNFTDSQQSTSWNDAKKTPLIVYNKVQSKLSIKGHSFLPNADSFYQPFISLIYQDLTENGSATVELQFESFGPKTAKVLFKFFENLRYFKVRNKAANIVWKYEEGDDTLMEMGEAFSELFDLNFEMKEIA